jgi:hypothetical protein
MRFVPITPFAPTIRAVLVRLDVRFSITNDDIYQYSRH